jgi:hypothetical protein
MTLQPIGTSNSRQGISMNPQSQLFTNGKTSGAGVPRLNGNSAILDTVSLSADTLSVNYTNSDGDSVTLSMEHIEYQKAMLAFSGDKDSEEWKKIVDKVKEEYLEFRERIIKKFIESLDSDSQESAGETETAAPAQDAEIPGLPEYWNAENTSQRIVDFAVSFYGVAEATGKEYYDMMRSAIEEGFNQAMGELGSLPDAVNSLAHKTIELALEKLEQWAVNQGIDVGENAAAV